MARSLMILLTSLFPVSAAMAAGVGSTPVPIGNPGEWVTSGDYPASALRSGTAGTTGFVLVVADDGTVADCSVASTSGSAELDAQACALISQRARFEPARDESGRAIAGTFASRVHWQIPDMPMLTSQSVQVDFDVNPDGSTANCKVRSSPEMPGIEKLCDLPSHMGFSDAAEAERGRKGVRHVVTRQSISIGDPQPVRK